jgi:hypothetical protein
MKKLGEKVLFLVREEEEGRAYEVEEDNSRRRGLEIYEKMGYKKMKRGEEKKVMEGCSFYY